MNLIFAKEEEKEREEKERTKSGWSRGINRLWEGTESQKGVILQADGKSAIAIWSWNFICHDNNFKTAMPFYADLGCSFEN